MSTVMNSDFLRIAEPAIAEIELTRRVLLRHEQAGRFNEFFLQIVVLDRAVVRSSLMTVAFLVTVICVPDTSGMMCWRISRQLS